MNEATSNSKRTPGRKANHDAHRTNRFEFGGEVREFIHVLPHHVMVFDLEGCFLYANQLVLDYTGRTLEEMVALGTEKRIREDIHPYDIRRGSGKRKHRFVNSR